MLPISSTTTTLTYPQTTSTSTSTAASEPAPAPAPLTKAQIEAAEAAAKAEREAAEAAAKADLELREDLEKAIEDAQREALERAEKTLQAQVDLQKELAERNVDLERQAELQVKLTLAQTMQQQADEASLLATKSLAAYYEAKNPPAIGSEGARVAGLVVQADLASQIVEKSVDVVEAAGTEGKVATLSVAQTLIRTSSATITRPVASETPDRNTASSAITDLQARSAPAEVGEDEARMMAEAARSAATYRMVIDGILTEPKPQSLNIVVGDDPAGPAEPSVRETPLRVASRGMLPA